MDMNNYDIKIKYFGSAFEGGIYDLQTVRLLSESSKEIFSSLLAIQLGQRELASELVSYIDYKVSIHSGVFEFACRFEKNFSEIFGISGMESVNARLSDSLGRLMYSSLALRRHVAEAEKKGSLAEVVIQKSRSESQKSISITEQGNIVLKDPKILWAAKMTQEPLDAIMKCIDGGVISNFEVEGLCRPLYFVEKDLLIVDQDKDKLTATINVQGCLEHMQFSRNRGMVMSDNDVYQISWDPELKMALAEHAGRNNVDLVMQPLISESNIDPNLVIYKIIDCVAIKSASAHSTRRTG